jgi:carboxyl-terminal processing protease
VVASNAARARRTGWGIASASIVVLTACGGGGGTTPSLGYAGLGRTGTGSSSGAGSDDWVSGIFQPSAHYAAQCQNPRSGIDPVSGQSYVDMQGSTLDENNWLRSWTNELYLWYSEVPDLDPGAYATTSAYFPLLKTSALTSTGAAKDRFHFTYPTLQWEQMSQGGVDIGYGLTFDIVMSTPPRQVYAAFVWSGYAAAAANVTRGEQVIQIDGVDMIDAGDQASIDTLNQGLSPASSGEIHTFLLRDAASGTERTVTLQASAVTETPVPIVTTVAAADGPVGYLLFNDHIATAESELVAGIQQLKSAGVVDLVLDIRYNGGGFLDIASELAYMIAGPVPTAGEAFDQIAFNAKYPNRNPVTGGSLSPTPFHATAQGFSSSPAAGTSLPYLGLRRVFILTGPGTCSASEAIMNGLTGVGIQVIQIGSTTCGKPYGFYPQDNCGTTYFSIQFQSDNAQAFGNYSDGFSPANAAVLTSAVLPGCSVADDFSHQLGDPAESRLSAALGYRTAGVCTVPANGVAAAHASERRELAVHRAPWREMGVRRP